MVTRFLCKFIIIIVTILIVVISVVSIRLLITWRLSGSEEKPAAFTECKMSALRLVIMLMAMRRRIKTTTLMILIIMMAMTKMEAT